MELIDITVDFCFEIITQNHNRYFKSKEIVEEIIVRKYNIPFVNIKYNNDVSLVKLKHQICRKLIPILCNLREDGRIEKYNRKFWKIKKG